VLGGRLVLLAVDDQVAVEPNPDAIIRRRDEDVAAGREVEPAGPAHREVVIAAAGAAGPQALSTSVASREDRAAAQCAVGEVLAEVLSGRATGRAPDRPVADSPQLASLVERDEVEAPVRPQLDVDRCPEPGREIGRAFGEVVAGVDPDVADDPLRVVALEVPPLVLGRIRGARVERPADSRRP
jgi:hypothetical protein